MWGLFAPKVVGHCWTVQPRAGCRAVISVVAARHRDPRVFTVVAGAEARSRDIVAGLAAGRAEPMPTAPQREQPVRLRYTRASRVTGDTWTAMGTGWAVSANRPEGWWSRFRHEWTKNDGKPWEEWAPGRDLKEAVLIAVIAILTIGQVAAMIWFLFG